MNEDDLMLAVDSAVAKSIAAMETYTDAMRNVYEQMLHCLNGNEEAAKLVYEKLLAGQQVILSANTKQPWLPKSVTRTIDKAI